MTSEVLGRQTELATLGAFLGRLPARPGALGLAGAAGAGKTLLRKFSSRERQNSRSQPCVADRQILS